MANSTKNPLVVALASLLVTQVANAALSPPGQVIFDAGTAYPVNNWVEDDFYQDLKKPESLEQLKNHVEMAAESFKPSKEMLPKVFPIEPELIKPVVLPGTQIIKELPALPQPLFVIGTDEYSVRWLNANKAVLEQYGASGVLTKARNQTEWEYMQQLAAPLQLWPMNADALADQLGVPGYPIMITRSGFFQ